MIDVKGSNQETSPTTKPGAASVEPLIATESGIASESWSEGLSYPGQRSRPNLSTVRFFSPEEIRYNLMFVDAKMDFLRAVGHELEVLHNIKTELKLYVIADTAIGSSYGYKLVIPGALWPPSREVVLATMGDHDKDLAIDSNSPTVVATVARMAPSFEKYIARIESVPSELPPHKVTVEREGSWALSSAEKVESKLAAAFRSEVNKAEYEREVKSLAHEGSAIWYKPPASRTQYAEFMKVREEFLGEVGRELASRFGIQTKVVEETHEAGNSCNTQQVLVVPGSIFRRRQELAHMYKWEKDLKISARDPVTLGVIRDLSPALEAKVAAIGVKSRSGEPYRVEI